MKKRALILAMIAFITAIASESAANTVYAEETQNVHRNQKRLPAKHWD